MSKSKSLYTNGFIVLMALGCGARLDVAESNTNWLAACGSDRDCGGSLTCECGVCTDACNQDDCPSELSCLAECGNSCQRSCTIDADCISLDEAASCRGGVCAVPAGGLSEPSMNEPGLVTSDEGATSVGSSSEDSTSASTGSWSETTSTSQDTPTASSETSATMTPDATEPGFCRVAHVEYPAGATVPADGCGTNTCLCNPSGRLVECTTTTCEFDGLGAIKPCDEMFPNGDVPTDHVTIDTRYIFGSTLNLNVEYGGGCARHDFAVCYRELDWSSQPTEWELVLIHDDHDDPCFGQISRGLNFDLTPLAERYMDERDTDGGYLATNYGIFAFGQLTCQDRDAAATLIVDEGISNVDTGCFTDNDCMSARVGGECYQRCNVVANFAEATYLERLGDSVYWGVCEGYFDAGCSAALPQCDWKSAVCVNGQCQIPED